MKNKDAQKYYDKLASRITNPRETRNKAKDFSCYDIRFMRNFENKDAILLDLGSGTGLLVNGIAGYFKKIVAVEKYPEFSKFISARHDVEVINADLMQFKEHRKFDIISAFGVFCFFNKSEVVSIYEYVSDILSEGGVFIIKHQMGVLGDVVVSGWSEELNAEYYAEYRFVDFEIDMLKSVGFSDITKIDIYPSEFNRFENTHFYALVCKKR